MGIPTAAFWKVSLHEMSFLAFNCTSNSPLCVSPPFADTYLTPLALALGFAQGGSWEVPLVIRDMRGGASVGEGTDNHEVLIGSLHDRELNVSSLDGRSGGISLLLSKLLGKYKCLLLFGASLLLALRRAWLDNG